MGVVMRVYVGHDPREQEAYRVAVTSLRRHSTSEVSITPLSDTRLRDQGLLWRAVDTRDGIYDLASNAPQATEFAVSRFLLPFLAQTGAALFIDCDMLFLADVSELFAAFDPRYAVQVVKHDHRPMRGAKMDGAVQTRYPRKNWSSVMLWNCDHPANRRLSLHDVNTRPGRDLHAFYWLADSEIGDLPPEWNWLVGERPRPERVKLAHFTNGGPWFPNWEPREHDDLWTEAAREYR